LIAIASSTMFRPLVFGTTFAYTYTKFGVKNVGKVNAMLCLSNGVMSSLVPLFVHGLGRDGYNWLMLVVCIPLFVLMVRMKLRTQRSEGQEQEKWPDEETGHKRGTEID